MPFALLKQHGEDAKILAGGHSPMMRLRFKIDIKRVVLPLPFSPYKRFIFSKSVVL